MLSEIEFLKLRDYFDKPLCGCKIKRQAACVADGNPCQERVDTGDCDCRYAIPKPCKHASQKLFQIPALRDETDPADAIKIMRKLTNTFTAELRRRKPKEFPPLPPRASLFTPAERTTAYMRRARKSSYVVVSNRDVTTFDSLGFTGEFAGNGRLVGYKIVTEQGTVASCRRCGDVEELTDGLCRCCSIASRRSHGLGHETEYATVACRKVGAG